MAFRVFHTSEPLAAGQREPSYDKLQTPTFDTKEQALDFACDVIKKGGLVLKIAGPGGLNISQSDLQQDCKWRNWKPYDGFETG